MRIFATLLFIPVYFQTTAQSIASNDTSKIIVSSYDSICLHPDVEAQFRKGSWTDFLQRNMTYPKEARKQEIQGTVGVQFIIETDGSLSNIQAVFGPKELREDAENLIKKSPKWIPALNNGKPVRTRRTQPIIYRLER